MLLLHDLFMMKTINNFGRTAGSTRVILIFYLI